MNKLQKLELLYITQIGLDGKSAKHSSLMRILRTDGQKSVICKSRIADIRYGGSMIQQTMSEPAWIVERKNIVHTMRKPQGMERVWPAVM